MCQLYTFVRLLLLTRHSPRERLLLLCHLLDLLEADYREVYPDGPEPLAGGYEEALRRLLEE